MKLSAEDQLAVLIRARAKLARRDGWGSKYRGKSRSTALLPRGETRLTLGEACQLAAFELGFVNKRNGTYAAAKSVGLLKHLDQWQHKSLAGFNDAPETKKKHVIALIDRRIVELM